MSDMTSAFYRRVAGIYASALQLRTTAREQFLRSQQDGEAANEAADLLASGLTSGDSLVLPVDILWQDSPSIGDVIGAYRLLGLIGSGGMGTVFLCERTDGAQAETKRYALKVLLPGLDSPSLSRRLLQEAAVLAALDHPGIVKLVDAGSHRGCPYLVMEHVDGVRIDEYCDHGSLTINDRLHLFKEVCAAIHYAHEQGVLHRDITPSNVLVSQEGRIRLLDFGLASSVEATVSDVNVSVVSALRLMTLPYAAPEQIRGEGPSRGTDVYGLGALLHVLVFGVPPFPVEDDSLEAVLKARDGGWSPAWLTHLKSASSTADQLAARRGESAASLLTISRGPLGQVLARALDGESRLRHPSAAALAEDVQRFLRGAPIRRPRRRGVATAARLTGRSLIGAAALLCGSFAFGGWSLYQHVSLDKARRAQASADARTQSLKAFLATLVDESDDPQPPSLQDRERLLDLASEQLSAPGAMAQEDRGRLLQSLSDVYKQRGDYARGESLALQAVGLRRSEAGLSLAESLDAVGDARRSAGRLDDAEAPLLEALSLRQAILGSNHPDVAESLNNLGLLRTDQGRLEEGQDLLRRATAIWQAHSSTEPGDDLVALGMTNQGLNLLKQRRLAEAAHHFKEALRRRRQVLPANSPRIATSLHLLGALRDQEGHKEEAAALMTEAHEIRLSVLGASHPVTWVSGRDLAFFYLFGGRLPEAERMASEVLAGLSSSHAESRASMEINMELILAHVTLETGRTREAKERAARAKTLIEKAGLTPVLKQPNVKALLAKIDQA